MVQENQAVALYPASDGGNPKKIEAIERNGRTIFLLRPFSEDGNPNYKFRLEVVAENHDSTPHDLNLEIQWDEPKYMHLRQELRIRGPKADQWDSILMDIEGRRAFSRIRLAPGNSDISLLPKYGYQDYLNAVEKISNNRWISKERLGISLGGREVWMIRCAGSRAVKPNRRIMLTARIHPYESAGSFCAEGMLTFLAQADEAVIQNDLNNAHVFIIPMAAVDGVAEGHCRLNAVGGVDLSKEADPGDQIGAMLQKAIDRVEPTTYCELHNWMFPDVDGIYYLSRRRAARFIRHMPSQEKFGKSWRPMLKWGFFPDPYKGFKKYCREHFHSTVLCLEYPWSRRQPQDMRALGVATLRALCRM